MHTLVFSLIRIFLGSLNIEMVRILPLLDLPLLNRRGVLATSERIGFIESGCYV